jgi:OCT family organic cation transporter-like MFS transporter 1
MSSSYVGELARFWTPLPMVLLGTPSLLAALVALKLPDTKGRALPETMEEAMELNVSNTKYYYDTNYFLIFFSN